MLTAQQIADKWASRAGSASTAYKDGIQQTNVNPMQLAVAQQANMVSKWNEAISSGRWANRMNSVSPETWKQAAMTKGASNYTTGIQAGKQKFVTAMNYYAQVYASIKDAVRSIPRDGGSGSIARMTMAMQMLQAAKQSRGR